LLQNETLHSVPEVQQPGPAAKASKSVKSHKNIHPAVLENAILHQQKCKL
jgi:hypothetical protein